MLIVRASKSAFLGSNSDSLRSFSASGTALGTLLDPSGQQRHGNSRLGLNVATCSGAFWQHFSHFWPSSCEYVFWMPSGVYKTQVTVPKKSRNGVKNGSQNARFGGLPNVSWIYYLLYLDHISVPRMGRKRPPKSKHASELLRKLIFNDLGRICVSIWEPIWHHFGSLWGVRF